MSIKSQKNHLDLPSMVIKNQRSPKYTANQRKESKELPARQVNNISSYVDENLKSAVKPRFGEKR